MELIRGITPTAPKILLYGLSGAGKSSLAAKLKNPIFLDIEGGLNFIDCVRTPQITSLKSFYGYLRGLYNTEKREFDTIVIDSADWLVRLTTEQAAGIDRDNLEMTLNKSNGGYGNGKQVLENHIRTKLLPTLVAMNTKGYGICLIAHAESKTMMDADGVNSEQITPKIDANTMSVFVEWVDNVLYLKKDAEGKRTLVFESDDVALAKNRLGLTGEKDLSEIDINKLLTMKEK